MAETTFKYARHEDARVIGIKRARTDETVNSPSKKVRILSEDEGSDKDNDNSDDSVGGGAKVYQSGDGFKVNEEYARRFEHNKKREDLHRC